MIFEPPVFYRLEQDIAVSYKSVIMKNFLKILEKQNAKVIIITNISSFIYLFSFVKITFENSILHVFLSKYIFRIKYFHRIWKE